MAKKTRKKAAAKAAKKSKVLTKKKSAKNKSAKKKVAKTKIAGRKAAMAKKRRKAAAKIAAKIATKTTTKIATKGAAPKTSAPGATTEPAAAPPRKSLVQRIEGAIGAVADILTDAERLHHRLDPDPTRDFDPE